MAQGVTREEYHLRGYWLRWMVVQVNAPSHPERDEDGDYSQSDWTKYERDKMNFFESMADYLDTIQTPYYNDLLRVAFEDREEAFIFKLRFG